MRAIAAITLLFLSFQLSANVDRTLLAALEKQLLNEPKATLLTIESKLENTNLSRETRLELQVLQAEAYVATGQIALSLQLAQKIIQDTKLNNLSNLHGKGLHRLASAQLYQGDLHLALKNYQSALTIFKTNGEQNMLANALMGIGSVYGQQGQLENALNFYLRSLKVMQQLENDNALGGLYNNIGSIHFWLNDFQSAIEYYQKSIDFSFRIEDTKQLALQYSNIGEAYTALKKMDLALQYFQIALTHIDDDTPPYYVIAINIPLGRYKLEKKEFEEATEHFNVVIKLANQSDTQDWVAEALLGKAASIENRDIDKAILLAKQGLELSKKINRRTFVREAHKLLALFFEQKNNYREAYKHSKLFTILNAQIVEQVRQAEMLNISGMLELEQKNHEISHLEEDREIQAVRAKEKDFRRNILSASIILLLLTLIFFYRLRTHRKQAQKEREVSEKLRKLDKLKDQFLANTSHELRTPLNAIIGLSNIILDSSSKDYVKSDVDNLVGLIHDSGEDLLAIVKDILDLAALKENKTKIDFKPIRLNELTDKLIAQKKLSRTNNNNSIESNLPDDLPKIRGDRQYLYRILLNLVDNAIKFTREGSVIIDARRVDDSVLISVIDSGIGIPHQYLASIFNRFEQVDGSSQRSFGGTGLGLAIVKELIELHGSHISVTSTEGKGTCFKFSLPVWSEHDPKCKDDK